MTLQEFRGFFGDPSPRAERAAMLLRSTPIQERETFRATQSGAPNEPNLGRSNSLKLYVEKEFKLVCRTDPSGRAERTQSGALSEPKSEGTGRAGRIAWPDLSCARSIPRASGKVFVNGISRVLDDVRGGAALDSRESPGPTPSRASGSLGHGSHVTQRRGGRGHGQPALGLFENSAGPSSPVHPTTG
jgi:hypothetical protein